MDSATTPAAIAVHASTGGANDGRRGVAEGPSAAPTARVPADADHRFPRIARDPLHPRDACGNDRLVLAGAQFGRAQLWR